MFLEKSVSVEIIALKRLKLSYRLECQLSVLSPPQRECHRREIVGGGCHFGPKHVSLQDPSRRIEPTHLLNRILFLKLPPIRKDKEHLQKSIAVLSVLLRRLVVVLPFSALLRGERLHLNFNREVRRHLWVPWLADDLKNDG